MGPSQIGVDQRSHPAIAVNHSIFLAAHAGTALVLPIPPCIPPLPIPPGDAD